MQWASPPDPHKSKIRLPETAYYMKGISSMNANRERTNELKVFLSDDEKYILDNKIKASGMHSKSEYIRHLIIYGYVYDIDYKDLQEYDRQLSIIGKNINMIRERIFKTGSIYKDDVKEIKELMEKVWHTHESMLSKTPLQKL